MAYQIIKPTFPPGTSYPYLASAVLNSSELEETCVKEMSVVGINSSTTITVEDENNERFSDIPVWIHTDVGARAALLTGTESVLPEVYFKNSAHHFVLAGEKVTVACRKVADKFIPYGVIDLVDYSYGWGTSDVLVPRPTFNAYLDVKFGVTILGSPLGTLYRIFRGVVDLATGLMVSVPTYDGSEPKMPMQQTGVFFFDATTSTSSFRDYIDSYSQDPVTYKQTTVYTKFDDFTSCDTTSVAINNDIDKFLALSDPRTKIFQMQYPYTFSEENFGDFYTRWIGYGDDISSKRLGEGNTFITPAYNNSNPARWTYTAEGIFNSNYQHVILREQFGANWVEVGWEFYESADPLRSMLLGGSTIPMTVKYEVTGVRGYLSTPIESVTYYTSALQWTVDDFLADSYIHVRVSKFEDIDNPLMQLLDEELIRYEPGDNVANSFLSYRNLGYILNFEENLWLNALVMGSCISGTKRFVNPDGTPRKEMFAKFITCEYERDNQEDYIENSKLRTAFNTMSASLLQAVYDMYGTSSTLYFGGVYAIKKTLVFTPTDLRVLVAGD